MHTDQGHLLIFISRITVILPKILFPKCYEYMLKLVLRPALQQRKCLALQSEQFNPDDGVHMPVYLC